MAEATTHDEGTDSEFLAAKQASYHRFVKLTAYGIAHIVVLLLLMAAFLL